MSLLLNPPLVRIPESMARDPEVAAYLRGINTQFEQLYRYLQQGSIPLDANNDVISSSFAAGIISGQGPINEDIQNQVTAVNATASSVNEQSLAVNENQSRRFTEIENKVSAINSALSSLSISISEITQNQGSLTALQTNDKDSLVESINELATQFNSIGHK